jgi:CelD/BcsL family acetyltransferase involved in cellulose biosynthesis
MIFRSQPHLQNRNQLRIHVIRDEQGFFELRTRWDELLRNSHYNLPFYSWAWYWTWWKHFGKDSELFIVVGEDATGRLSLVAPLMKKNTKLRKLSVSKICFMENGIGPRNYILRCRTGEAIDASKAMIECLAEHSDEWDIVTLSNVEYNKSDIEAMRKLASDHDMYILEEPARQSPYIMIDGEFSTYWTSNFDSKQRNNIRRRMRMLGERGHYRIIDHIAASNMDAALQSAFQVSASSWKRTTNSDMAGSDVRKAFYVDITNLMAKAGLVRIWLLELEGCPIAVQYQLISDNTIHLLINDFDESYRDLAPGIILLYSVIEQLHKENVKEFDFCGNAYEYKMGWANGIRRHVTIQLFSRKYYSRFIFITKTIILPMFRDMHNILRRFLKRGSLRGCE